MTTAEELSQPSVGSWHLLTPEYPPVLGGVGAHSLSLAARLSQEVGAVQVWTAGDHIDHASVLSPRSDVRAHHVDGLWRRGALRTLSDTLDEFDAPRRLLVQYVPNAFTPRPVNLALGRLLQQRRARGDSIWTIVHEPWYPFRWRDRPQRWVLSALHRRMLRVVLGSSSRVFVSTAAWLPLIVRSGTRSAAEAVTLPVCAGVEPFHDAGARDRLREPLGDRTVVGVLSRFREDADKRPGSVLAALADNPAVTLLLMGAGSKEVAHRLVANDASRAQRVHATGAAEAESLSLNVQCCDVMVQTYPDGITTRRGSAMTALAHGVALVTNGGPLTEPFWVRSNAVSLAATQHPGPIMEKVDELLARPDRRLELGAAGLALYEAEFSSSRMVERLLA